MLTQARREPEAGGAFLAYLWALLAGLLVPILVILIGLMATLLNTSGLAGDHVRLGAHLVVPIAQRFTDQTPMLQLTELVGVSFLVASIFSLAVWLHRRAADARARRIVKALHARVLKQSLRRAELEGAAAQHVRAEQLIGTQLPALQRGLSLWYRAIPRSLLTWIGCVTVALLVNVWLAMLAVVSGILLWQLFRRLRRTDVSDLSDWEVPRARGRMAELVGQAPLLARLQSQGLTDHAFTAELETLYRRLTDEDARLGRIWPLVFFALSAAIAIMVLGLGVNLFGDDSGLSLPAALVLGLSLGGVVAASGRLLNLVATLNKTSQASDSIYQYLHRSTELAPSEQRVGLAGLRDSVEIHDVTLGDPSGRPILSHLSLKLQPRSMVAVLGTDDVASRAMAELLMGFGMPSEGRVTIDGVQLRDVHPQALAKNVTWIEPAGPIWEGTIYQNLRGDDESINNGDIVEALQRVDVYERLQRLPDALNTIVSPAEAMLNAEARYALGVARAILHRAPVVLASEPPPPAEHLANDPCLTVLRQLADNGSLVVILPRRLQTLRCADRVVLLNGPRLVGEGKHADLLAESDLYRHLNYLLFNPYRHQKA